MLFAIMPRAVIGAALVFTAAFVLVNGIEVVTSRILDARRALMIGLALTAAASVDVFPQFFATLPPALRPFFVSSLAAGTLVASALNAIFRLGVRQARRLEIDPAQVDAEAVHGSSGEQGARGGAARRDRAGRLQPGAVRRDDRRELRSRGPARGRGSFDEFNLDVRISYPGAMLEFPDRSGPATRRSWRRRTVNGSSRGSCSAARPIGCRRRSEAGRATVLFHFDH